MPDPQTSADTALGIGKYVAGFSALAGALLLGARRIGSAIRQMGASDETLGQQAKFTKELQDEVVRERKRREEEVDRERQRRIETEEALRLAQIAETACGQRSARLEGRMEGMTGALADAIREHETLREEIADLRRENNALRVAWNPDDTMPPNLR